MSYILNALRKSEQERQVQSVDTLENRIQDKPEHKAKAPSIWLIVLVVFNLLFILYFGWSYTKDQNIESKVEAIVVEKPIIIKEEPELKIEKELVAKVSPVLEQKEDYQTLSIAEQIEDKRTKVKLLVKQKKITEPIVEDKPLVVGTDIQPKKVAQVIVQTETIADELISDKGLNDFPFLSELDYEFRRKVPVIDINVYVYAEKESERFIMIAMKKYSSGQEIVSGLLLKQIRINSLVVEYKNKVFQIKRK